jgi:hypothetical protein
MTWGLGVVILSGLAVVAVAVAALAIGAALAIRRAYTWAERLHRGDW